MVFPPKGVFYKSPTSIWLQNGELTPNKKSPKIGFQNKTETLNNPNKNAAEMSSMVALIPIVGKI